jgi:glycosyltransferase involved in cell wall biosynthesis
VVTLDDTMAERLRTGGAKSVTTIPNWADGAAIVPDRQAGEICRQMLGLEQRFVVLYSGNMGLAHQFDAVMEAAKRCVVELPNVLFLFVGNGPRLGEVRQAAECLPNFRFMDYQPRENLNQLYNAADIHLVTLRDEVSGLLFPSKYAAALAAGKPVLLVGGSGTSFGQEIRKEELGWAYPHQAWAVMDALRKATKSPKRREYMGRNARRVFEMRYSKVIAMQRWEQVLRSIFGNEGASGGGFADTGQPAVFDRNKAVSVRRL